MGRLRTEEVRRLLPYLSERVANPEQLAEIEAALRDEDAEEFLREPDPTLLWSIDYGERVGRRTKL